MAGLNHQRLVRLFGFCFDVNVQSGKQEQILVYEFVPNGDLHKFIHGPSGGEAAVRGTVWKWWCCCARYGVEVMVLLCVVWCGRDGAAVCGMV